MTFLIVFVWVMALMMGGVLTVGIIAIVTGRAPFPLSTRTAWTPREGRQLGVVWTVVSATYAIYSLLGGLVLGLELESRSSSPNPLIGHWWGFFVPMVPGLVLICGLLAQLEIYNRHRRRLSQQG